MVQRREQVCGGGDQQMTPEMYEQLERKESRAPVTEDARG